MISQAVYNGARTVGLRNVDDRHPRPGYVLVDVAYTGVCGTDLHIFHGDMDARVHPPAVIGHEMSGTIAAVGDKVTAWTAGQPVTVMPLAPCGRCPACRMGHSHVCHRLVFLGIDAEGCMQQTWEVPAHTLIRLPADLPLRHAALVEPTAVAVHDVRRANLAAGDKTVVVGGGPVGVLIGLVAQHEGAAVLVVEPNPARRDIAHGAGLTTLDPQAVDVAAHVESWTDGRGAAIAFEVSGAPAGVDTAVNALATRGRLCLVAIHPRPREVNLHRFFWRELTLVGARLYDRSDFGHAVELVASGVVPADHLITATVGLSHAADAFAQIESGGGVMKVLVDCGAQR